VDKSAALLQRIASLSPEKQTLLLRKLAAASHSEGGVDGEAIKPLPGRQQAPLSHSQQLLWLVEQREGPSAKYNMPCAYRLSGVLDAAAMVETFKTIVRRHDSLRTWFSDNDGDPIQCVDRDFELNVEIVDLGALPESERDRRVAELVQENVDWTFDVARLPLVRIALLRTAPDEHYLLMNLHHIIYDGWSKGLLLKEMAVLYPAFRDGHPDPASLVPTLPVQYGDYAAWQREGLQLEVERQLGYWRGKLAGELSLLELPSDRPRPALPSGGGAGMLVHVPRFLTEQVEALGRAEGASTYMAMLAAFKALLARLSGRRDILVGSPVDNRNRSELLQLIGYFLNTSVLRTEVDPAASFRALLAAVKRTCLEAYQNQDVALGQVIDAVNPVRSLSYTPLFQVMFVFQNAGSANFVMPGIHIERADAVNTTSKYDLYLSFQDTDDGLKGWWTYNTDLYDADTIAYFSRCLLTLLLDAVANPDKPVGRLLLQEPGSEANDSVPGLPFRSLAEIFVERAAAMPDAPALLDERGVTSYAELAGQASRFASSMRARGVGRGDIVAIVLSRSVDQVAAMIAAVLCGAAYLPVDPELPAARIGFQLADAGPALVVTSAELLSVLGDSTIAPVVTVDSLADAEPAALPPLPAVTADDLLYVLYTSGSTGQPKGVRGTLGSTHNRLAWMWGAFPYAAGDVCCIKTTVNFVDAVAELWSPLLAGVPAALVAAADVRDVYGFVRKLAGHRVTHLVAVPSLLRALIDAYPELHDYLPCLRSVVSSGEALTVDLVHRLREALPGTQLLNLYGSTEVAADATAQEVVAIDEHDRQVPVGRAISGLRTYVLDAQLEACPIGVSGELYIGGAGVNAGYHRQSALTAARFLPDPFALVPGARMFKSGDLARARRGGALTLLGRSDHQVKIRGVRIELLEIRAALLLDPDLADAYVVCCRDGDTGDWLAAYLVAQEDRDVVVSEVVTRLRSLLPDYMVPAAFQVLPALPLNANGKVDLQALPTILRASANGPTVYVAPVTDTECEVAAIWQDRLKVDQVGRDANFFDLGGHSLIATRIVAAVRQRFGIDVSARDLFATMTVEAFSRRIDSLREQTHCAEATSEYVVNEY